jgi:hypothetical protein
MTYGNGNKFEGEWLKGDRKHGTYTYPNGDKYTGEFFK